MEKQAYKKIKPLRYVYHVSYPSCRDSIEKGGLPASYNKIYEEKCVFAHNAGHPDMRWYPFCFDEPFYWEKMVDFESRELDFLYFMLKYGYDFWQIDTRKAGIDWFIDKYGMEDFYGGINYPFLIMAFDNVPREALRLYTFHESPMVLRGEGVAHVEGYFRAA